MRMRTSTLRISTMFRPQQATSLWPTRGVDEDTLRATHLAAHVLLGSRPSTWSFVCRKFVASTKQSYMRQILQQLPHEHEHGHDSQPSLTMLARSATLVHPLVLFPENRQAGSTPPLSRAVGGVRSHGHVLSSCSGPSQYPLGSWRLSPRALEQVFNEKVCHTAICVEQHSEKRGCFSR